jgi:hypothetical protein
MFKPGDILTFAKWWLKEYGIQSGKPEYTCKVLRVYPDGTMDVIWHSKHVHSHILGSNLEKYKEKKQ